MAKRATRKAKAAPGARQKIVRRVHNPPSIAPGTNYSHGIETAPGARHLAIAGQVGRDANGHVPDGIDAQATLAWANVRAVLESAGMTMNDIVHYFSFVVRREDNAGYDRARREALGDARPASTKVFISGLAQPELLCEVQAFAAKVDQPARSSRTSAAKRATPKRAKKAARRRR
ncbi:MAG TPA: Rid family hydrolase [Alphaproteobacteria bacterium]|jgi:2-iminobutanoate/2-iminopropanoate deaminase|nr:Rid family hydrolase [Alphaproteobacteria bacterium]